MNNNIIFVNQNKYNEFGFCIIINGQHYMSSICNLTDTKEKLLKKCEPDIIEFATKTKIKLSIKDFTIIENKQEVCLFCLKEHYII